MRRKGTLFIIIAVFVLLLVSCGDGSYPTGSPTTEQYKGVRIIIPEDAEQYVKMAADRLYEFFGEQYPDIKKQTESQYEVQEDVLYILLSTDINEAGYSIKYLDNKINIQANCADLVYLAASRIINDVFENKSENITENNLNKLNISEKSASRQEYIQDIELFTPVWQYEWNPPEWLLDFEEKKQSFTVSGRMMCAAHRGGIQFYPENSIEAIISSVKMGCDIVEVDAQITKDGVIVLLHGDLDVCTDWENKKGTDGLPKSKKVIAWTYEELLQLNLLFNYGQYTQSDSEISPYKIPTLSEVMTVCKGRIFVNIDKLDCVKYWDKVYSVLKETQTTQNYLFGKSFKDQEIALTAYCSQMRDDNLPVSMNYYGRTHTGNLDKDIALSGEKELNNFFTTYNKKGNNLLTDHAYECVKWISEQYIGE